jgi:hypothetical protein
MELRPADEQRAHWRSLIAQEVLADPTAPGFALLRRHFGSVRGVVCVKFCNLVFMIDTR